MTRTWDRWVARGNRLAAWADRYPILARHIAAFRRANGLRFTRWASGMGLFGYLSLFPLAVLASWALATVLRTFPEVQSAAEDALAEALTVNGLLVSADSLDLDVIAANAASAGMIGLLGLLFAGVGWIDSTIEGVRRMLGAMRRPRPYPLLLLEDVLWLLVLGSLLVVALGLTVLASSFGQWLQEQLDVGWLNWSSSGLLANLTSAVLVLTVLVGLFGFAWNRPGRRWRPVVLGSLMAAVGIVVLWEFAFVFVGRTLSNPVYGALAIAAAMLLLIYFASMVILYCACWIAVCEQAPVPVEEAAYYSRVQGGPVNLPPAIDARDD